MMGTTANFGFPYPESSDQPFVHTDIKNLADSVDTAMSGTEIGDWVNITFSSGWNRLGSRGLWRVRREGDWAVSEPLLIGRTSNITLAAMTSYPLSVGTLPTDVLPVSSGESMVGYTPVLLRIPSAQVHGMIWYTYPNGPFNVQPGSNITLPAGSGYIVLDKMSWFCG